jgi:queuine tRNA-ribosyltransferase
MMVLDECSAFGDSQEKVQKAMERTQLWAERCLRARTRDDLSLYAIVQGGMYPELRKQSAACLTGLDFPGYAIGGLSVGEPKDITLSLVASTAALLPGDKTRYLMGVGAPEDILEGVARGIDIFDCALPTRVARNGALFTPKGRVNIRRAVYAKMDRPIDPSCDCYTCRHFSAAYLSHLFRSEELLALRLASIHNLRFIASLMHKIRASILAGSFEEFRADFLADYRTTDEQARVDQKRRWLQGRA